MKKTKKEVKTEQKATRAMKRHAAKTARYRALYDLVGGLASELADLRMSDGYTKLCPIDKHICDMELAAYDQLSAVLGFKIRWADARVLAPNGDDLHRLPEAQTWFIEGQRVLKDVEECKAPRDKKPAAPMKPAKAVKPAKAGKAKECPHCGDGKAPAKKAECSSCDPCRPCKGCKAAKAEKSAKSEKAK